MARARGFGSFGFGSFGFVSVVFFVSHLPGDSCWNDHNVTPLESALESGVLTGWPRSGRGQVTRHLGPRRAVRDVRGDPGGADDVVERHLVDQRRDLAEEGGGLADATGGAEDANLDPTRRARRREGLAQE